jgi:hypothetical protein
MKNQDTDQLILDELCKALTYETCRTCRFRASARCGNSLATWKCPRIGLYTCNEAPACNAYEDGTVIALPQRKSIEEKEAYHGA